MSGAREHHWDIAPLHFFFPGLAGRVHGQSHQWAKETFIKTLRTAAPLNGVFLQMHGTAVADRFDDCDGDLLGAIRAEVGEKVPIIAVLDGHANVTPLMVRQASMLIGVKTNPHYDYLPAGRQAARMMAGMLDRSITPVSAWAQPPMVPALQKLYIAPGWPMDHLMRLARIAPRPTRESGRLLLGGFFVSERPETGISVTVTANREQGLQSRSRSISRMPAGPGGMSCIPTWFRSRMRCEAIASDEGPIVLGDLADSGGAGTPAMALRFWPNC